MAYVIAEPCIGVKDTACVDACPVDCIHPKKDESDFEDAPQLYIDPSGVYRLWRLCARLSSLRDLCDSMTCRPNGTSLRKLTRSTTERLQHVDAWWKPSLSARAGGIICTASTRSCVHFPACTVFAFPPQTGGMRSVAVCRPGGSSPRAILSVANLNTSEPLRVEDNGIDATTQRHEG